MATVKGYDVGVTINVPASGAISEGLLYGLNSTGQAVAGDRSTPQKAVGIAVAALSAAQATRGVYVALAMQAIVECAAADIAGGAFTVGAEVYLDTAGKYTTTKPSTAAQILQRVGVALTATKVAANVAGHALTLQAAATSTINA